MWEFFRKKGNRELVGWVCGGLAVLVGAGWAVFTYFVPADSAKPQANPPQVDCTIEAHRSVAACRDINVGGSIAIGNNDKIPKPAN
jgi:hypothetical protein